MDIDSALRQIRTGWKFLELIFCKETIAAKGYRSWENVLKIHRYRKELESKKLFLVRYVHLLDSVFQELSWWGTWVSIIPSQWQDSGWLTIWKTV
jgi:hypothetical protein